MEKNKILTIVLAVLLVLSLVGNGVLAYLYIQQNDRISTLEDEILIWNQKDNNDDEKVAEVEENEADDEPLMFEKEGWDITFEMQEDWEVQNRVPTNNAADSINIYLQEVVTESEAEQPYIRMSRNYSPDLTNGAQVYMESLCEEFSLQCKSFNEQNLYTNLTFEFGYPIYRLQINEMMYRYNYYIPSESGDFIYTIEVPILVSEDAEMQEALSVFNNQVKESFMEILLSLEIEA